MPEGPEVETIVRQLNKAIPNRVVVESITITYPRVLKDWGGPSFAGAQGTGGWLGWELISIRRRGKFIEWLLSADEEPAKIIMHLGMTGVLSIGKPEPKNQSFFLTLAENRIFRFGDNRRFGKLYIACGHQEVDAMTQKVYKNIGPDALAMNMEVFCQRLGDYAKRYPKRTIKHTLLDQVVVSGIGNIYACESLFLAKISPMSTNEQALRLRSGFPSPLAMQSLGTAVNLTLAQAMNNGGSSISDYLHLDGSEGSNQKYLAVFRQAQHPCKRNCGGMIQRIDQEGRGTYYCPVCQPAFKEVPCP